MKKIFYCLVAAFVLAALCVSCEVDYDKLPDNEKYQQVISDIGTSSQMTLEDILKSPTSWGIKEYFLFEDADRKNVKSYIRYGLTSADGYTGSLSLADHSFSFKSKFKYSYTDIGKNPLYYGYIINYDYSITPDGSISIHTDQNIPNPSRFPTPLKMKVVAYNIDNIVLEVDMTNEAQRYVSFVLKSQQGNADNVNSEYLENWTDYETYERTFYENK